jgi:hypothetical protein
MAKIKVKIKIKVKVKVKVKAKVKDLVSRFFEIRQRKISSRFSCSSCGDLLGNAASRGLIYCGPVEPPSTQPRNNDCCAPMSKSVGMAFVILGIQFEDWSVW